MEFEFCDMNVGIICMWFESVGPYNCTHVRMDVREKRCDCKCRRIRKNIFYKMHVS